MQAKTFNPQVFLEFICYLAFGGLMYYLVSSGKYLNYVTPRMKPYLYFTGVVMAIWACTGLFRLFRPQHKIRSAHCFVLTIPVLFLLLPHGPLSTADLSSNYVGGNALTGVTSNTGSADDPSNSIDTSIPEEEYDALEEEYEVPEEEYSAILPGLDEENKTITVSDDTFGMWLSEIYVNMPRFEGYKITMTGFVFKDVDSFKEDEFVPARLAMSCCVADLAPTGLLCKYDKASELKTDSWVKVEGTLHIVKCQYNDIEYDDPQIFVTKITPAEEVEGYVYPY
ncbi:putative membrane protein [Mobilisporobacter senegalensis]|uniref:Putative membrane protein n=1 Tax=Mobilisporobacter senegalensis TaxID=1329262 RepID=A0A3N1XB61_9FIRM|nr:TIGR03943 family protein [Mobilisporobacter senegalensis]ROR23955.1 putative membrane protein [Mobilisporobacter senegalensis]